MNGNGILNEYLNKIRAYTRLVSKTREGITVKINYHDWVNKATHDALALGFATFGAAEIPGQQAFFVPVEQEAEINEKVKRKFILLTNLIDGPTPRFDYTSDSLLPLRKSMEKMKPEDLKPIDVIPARIEGKYLIYDGKRRRHCATSLNWSGLWADVHYGFSSLQIRERSFALNDSRLGFTETEKGAFYRSLMVDFPEDYPTQQKVADRWNVSQPYVCQLIKGFELQQRLNKTNANNEGNIISTLITLNPTQSQAISKLPIEEQAQAAESVLGNKLTQTETRAYVANLKKESEETNKFNWLEETPTEPAVVVDTSFALEATSADALEKERVEAARLSALKRKLCEVYPDALVDFAIERLGRMGENKFSGVHQKVFSTLWTRLTVEEQTKLLEDACEN